MRAKALFHLVDQIRAIDKYFDVSLNEIRRLMMATGKCHLLTEIDLTDTGEVVTAELRLNISTKAPVPFGWTMALKLHDIRIDCIDYEAKYKLKGGGIGRGWHRHVWDPDEESAKRLKVPVSVLDGITSRDEFLVRGMSVMNIRVSAFDHGQPDLQFT